MCVCFVNVLVLKFERTEAENVEGIEESGEEAWGGGGV